MSNSWYNIVITADGLDTVNGYFSLDNDTSIVNGFYRTINGITNFDINTINVPGLFNSDNVFDAESNLFSRYGTWFSVTNVNLFGSSVSKVLVQYFEYTSYDGYTTVYKGGVRLSDGNQVPTSNFDYVVTSVSDPTVSSVPACFNEGTKILCLNKQFEEEYIPVENLRKGDIVKSYKHGYRKIDLIGKNSMVNNPDIYYECMYKMEKTDSNGLIDDLMLTGLHSILVDDLQEYQEYKEKIEKIFNEVLKIDDKFLLLSGFSKDFVKMENNDEYTYYHFCLENNGNDNEVFGVWTNGILTESTSKNEFIKQNYILL